MKTGVTGLNEKFAEIEMTKVKVTSMLKCYCMRNYIPFLISALNGSKFVNITFLLL
jgi:hypothetical protein